MINCNKNESDNEKKDHMNKDLNRPRRKNRDKYTEHSMSSQGKTSM